jgi:CDP-diacylglycerol--serine O-phosphatidyltransferase
MEKGGAFDKKAVPLRRLAPNLITLLGLCAGLTAIRMAIEGKFDLAIAAIVIAAVFDALDGRMARLLKANSKFGAELDSLADFVNFGVAPAITLYLWGLSAAPSIGWIAALIFAIAAALRLARFNVAQAEDKPAWTRAFFIGAPTPAGAVLLLFPLYLHGLGAPKEWFFAPLLVIHAFGVAALMISNVPTFSGKFDHAKIERNHAPAVIVTAVSCAAMLVTYPFLTLTVMTVVYAGSIFMSPRAYRALEAEDAKSAGKAVSLAARLSVVNNDTNAAKAAPGN